MRDICKQAFVRDPTEAGDLKCPPVNYVALEEWKVPAKQVASYFKCWAESVVMAWWEEGGHEPGTERVFQTPVELICNNAGSVYSSLNRQLPWTSP